MDENTFSTIQQRDGDDREVTVFLLNGLEGFNASYNIAPTKNELIIYRPKSDVLSDKLEYVFETLGFGLIPVWAKPQDPSPTGKGSNVGEKYSKEVQRNQSRHFNCRKESLQQRSSIWASAKNFRCVVPIQGYFEWIRNEKDKLPYYVHSSKEDLIYLAGFYSHNFNYKDQFNCKNEDKEYFSTFTIVTGPAGKDDRKDLSWLHSRKPLFLKPGSKEWDDWLDPNIEWSDELLDSCLDTVNNEAYDDVVSYRVSKDVGKVTSQGEYLIKEIKKENKKGIDGFFKKRPKEETETGGFKKIKTE